MVKSGMISRFAVYYIGLTSDDIQLFCAISLNFLVVIVISGATIFVCFHK